MTAPATIACGPVRHKAGPRRLLMSAAAGLCALMLAACQPVNGVARGPQTVPGAPVKVALLVPGGSAHRMDKRWPPEHFAHLAVGLDKAGFDAPVPGGFGRRRKRIAG